MVHFVEYRNTSHFHTANKFLNIVHTTFEHYLNSTLIRQLIFGAVKMKNRRFNWMQRKIATQRFQGRDDEVHNQTFTNIELLQFLFRIRFRFLCWYINGLICEITSFREFVYGENFVNAYLDTLNCLWVNIL